MVGSPSINPFCYLATHAIHENRPHLIVSNLSSMETHRHTHTRYPLLLPSSLSFFFYHLTLPNNARDWQAALIKSILYYDWRIYSIGFIQLCVRCLKKKQIQAVRTMCTNRQVTVPDVVTVHAFVSLFAGLLMCTCDDQIPRYFNTYKLNCTLLTAINIYTMIANMPKRQVLVPEPT